MVLTEEQQSDAYPLVTFEDGALPNEQAYYEHVTTGLPRTTAPSGFNGGSNGAKVQLLRKSTTSIGWVNC